MNPGIRSAGMFRFLVLLALLLPAASSWSLGLGEIEVYSNLNEGLDARIPIRATEKERQNLRISYASQEDFTKAGLRYNENYARNFNFSIEEKTDGSIYAIISSRMVVREPILLLLVRLESLSGSLLREYTALLDFKSRSRDGQGEQLTKEVQLPAVTRPGGGRGTGTVPVTRPKAGAGVAAGKAATTVRTPTTGTRRARAVQVQGNAYKVNKGDTLWEIALSARRGSSLSIQQIMLSLLQHNPDAFFLGGNINALHEGAVLNMPDFNAVGAVTNAQAIAAVGEQNRLWLDYKRGRIAAAPSPLPAATTSAPAVSQAAPGTAPRTVPRVVPKRPPPQTAPKAAPQQQAAPPKPQPKPQPTPSVQVVGADDGASGQGSDLDSLRRRLVMAEEAAESRSQEVRELSERLGENEEIINDLRRIVELRDNELTAMQNQVRESEKRLAQQVQQGDPSAAEQQSAQQRAEAEAKAQRQAAEQQAAAEAQRLAEQQSAQQKAAEEAQRLAAQQQAAQQQAAQQQAAQQQAAQQQAAQQQAAQQQAAAATGGAATGGSSNRRQSNRRHNRRRRQRHSAWRSSRRHNRRLQRKHSVWRSSRRHNRRLQRKHSVWRSSRGRNSRRQGSRQQNSRRSSSRQGSRRSSSRQQNSRRSRTAGSRTAGGAEQQAAEQQAEQQEAPDQGTAVPEGERSFLDTAMAQANAIFVGLKGSLSGVSDSAKSALGNITSGDFSGLMTPQNMAIGGGALGIPLLVALGIYLRRRRSQSEDEYEYEDEEDDADAVIDELMEGGDDSITEFAGDDEATVIGAEIPDEAEAAAEDIDVDLESTEDELAATEIMDLDMDELEELDVDGGDDVDGGLSEFNVLVAYGHYDKALDLIDEKITESPDNVSLKIKRMEVFASQGDQEEFEKHASKLKETLSGDSAEWKSIESMWEEMGSGREMFSTDHGASEDLESTQRLTPEMAKEAMAGADLGDELEAADESSGAAGDIDDAELTAAVEGSLDIGDEELGESDTEDSGDAGLDMDMDVATDSASSDEEDDLLATASGMAVDLETVEPPDAADLEIDTGDAGDAGLDMDSGDAGVEMDSGEAGLDMDSGDAGVDMDSGEAGLDMDSGDAGVEMDSGEAGLDMDSGDAGVDMDTGEAGLDMDSGDAGVDMDSGEAGLDMDSGDAGVDMDSGDAGLDMDSGDAGVDMDSGDAGLDMDSGDADLDVDSATDASSGDEDDDLLATASGMSADIEVVDEGDAGPDDVADAEELSPSLEDGVSEGSFSDADLSMDGSLLEEEAAAGDESGGLDLDTAIQEADEAEAAARGVVERPEPSAPAKSKSAPVPELGAAEDVGALRQAMDELGADVSDLGEDGSGGEEISIDMENTDEDLEAELASDEDDGAIELDDSEATDSNDAEAASDQDIELDLDIDDEDDGSASIELDDDGAETDPGTKLDLARAYIELGDTGSASDALNDVIQQGNDSQRQEAQTLLSQIG